MRRGDQSLFGGSATCCQGLSKLPELFPSYKNPVSCRSFAPHSLPSPSYTAMPSRSQSKATPLQPPTPVPTLSSLINEFHILFPKLVAAKDGLTKLDDPTSTKFKDGLLSLFDILVSSRVSFLRGCTKQSSRTLSRKWSIS